MVSAGWMGKGAVNNPGLLTILFPVQRVTQPPAGGLRMHTPMHTVHTRTHPCTARAHTHTFMLTHRTLGKWACPHRPVTLPTSPPGGTRREPRFLEAYRVEGTATWRWWVGSATDPLCHLTLHFSEPWFPHV